MAKICPYCGTKDAFQYWKQEGWITTVFSERRPNIVRLDYPICKGKRSDNKRFGQPCDNICKYYQDERGNIFLFKKAKR